MTADAAVRWLSTPAGLAAQWAGVFAGPVAWALDETISYSLVKWACDTRHTLVLHAVSIVSLAIIVGGAAASWTAWTRAGRDTAGQRARFLALLGLVTCGLFIVLVIATAIPRWVLDACQQ